jgi:3'(2'), 5'-bisphosphate nucleotidase
VADFAAQAVINTVLSHAFPDDPIIGEEDAADLRAATPESDVLRARVVELADDVLAHPPRVHAGERAEWGLGKRWGTDALLGAIDRGCHIGGRTGRTFPPFPP